MFFLCDLIMVSFSAFIEMMRAVFNYKKETATNTCSGRMTFEKTSLDEKAV